MKLGFRQLVFTLF